LKNSPSWEGDTFYLFRKFCALVGHKVYYYVYKNIPELYIHTYVSMHTYGHTYINTRAHAYTRTHDIA